MAGSTSTGTNILDVELAVEACNPLRYGYTHGTNTAPCNRRSLVFNTCVRGVVPGIKKVARSVGAGWGQCGLCLLYTSDAADDTPC
eukprot:469457-Prorocentrum_minimum.AAC.4